MKIIEALSAISILLFIIFLMIWYFTVSTVFSNFPSQHQITSVCAKHKGLQQVYSNPPLGGNIYIICKDGYGDFAP